METKETIDPGLNKESVVVTNKIRNARKEGITKGALTTGTISIVLVIALGAMVYTIFKREQKTQLGFMEDQRISFTRELISRDSTINDWLATFDEIEKNLNLIKQKENLITFNSSGGELSKDRRDQILEDIKYINTLMEENKKKIARLNSQLKESGGTIKGLQTRIAGLEESMKLYDNEITELKSMLTNKDMEIVQLNDHVVALYDTLSLKNETIHAQTSKINQAFLTSGTYKDLKEKGLITKEGGFLGLGRKEFMTGDFADSIFTEVDITLLTTIPVNSRDVKLITEHPTTSYELVKENEKRISYIAIKDPEEFWKISKYAVVEIVK